MFVIKILSEIYDRLTAGGSTEEQAVQSGVWVTGINVSDRALQLLKVIILARLLSPEAFGLLGIALLAIAALRQFSKLGFNEALIQNESEDVDDYLNTAWLMKILRGVSIAMIAFFTAPYLATFFGEPQSEPLIQMIGFSPLILGLQNPAVMYFQKNLNFHKEFIYQVGGRLVDLIVAVAIALIFESVWALAIGIIAMDSIKAVLSYGIHEYRPTIEFNFEFAREMFGFGKWMLVQAILVFLITQGDDGFVGWYFSAAALGYYQIGYRYSNAPATEVTHVITRVAFPSFSKVQHNIDRLRSGFYKVMNLSLLVSLPMAAGIIAVAPQFVYAVLGNQWGPMVPIMQVLAIWGAIRSFSSAPGEVFKAVGTPEYNVYILAIKLAVIAATIYPAAEMFGVLGVGYVIVGHSIITEPIRIHLVLRILEANFMEFAKLVFYPLIGSIGMGGIVMSVDNYVIAGKGIPQLVILVIVGVVVYIAVMLVFEQLTSYDVTELLHTIRDSV